MKLSMIDWDLKRLIGRSTKFTCLINFAITQDQRCLMIDQDLEKKIGRLTDSMGLINYALTHNKIFSMTN